MEKVNLPPGLIRYSSQDSLDKKPQRFLRARTIIYPIILTGIITGLVFAIGSTYGFDARIIRGKGAPFTQASRGVTSNTFSLRLVNRTDKPQEYALTVVSPTTATVEILDGDSVALEPGKTSIAPLNIRFPSALTYAKGNHPIILKVVDSSGNHREIDFRVLGPRQ